MAKLCSLYATLLLLYTSGAMMGMVAGDPCMEGCMSNDECNSKCSNAHQGNYGICMPDGGTNQCWCRYQCPPAPSSKTCDVGLGVYAMCNNDACNADCVSKYPDMGASGYCYSVGDPQYDTCHCRYSC